MGRNVYRVDFEPLALPREHLGIFWQSKLEWYRVEYVDALYPFRINFGAITAGASTGKKELKDESYMGNPAELRLLELKLRPIDDVEVELYNPGAIVKHYVTDVIKSTKIKKRIAEHHRSDRYTATGVQGPLWQITTNRRARVKRLTLTNESAADAWIYLCKSDGTRLSASFKVPAGQTLVLDEEDLDAEFVDDLYLRFDQQPISCDIKVVEHVFEDYDNLCVIYGMRDRMPSVDITNPTNYDIAQSWLEFSGYMYYLTKVDKEPEKWTFVPLAGFAGIVELEL